MGKGKGKTYGGTSHSAIRYLEGLKSLLGSPFATVTEELPMTT